MTSHLIFILLPIFLGYCVAFVVYGEHLGLLLEELLHVIVFELEEVAYSVASGFQELSINLSEVQTVEVLYDREEHFADKLVGLHQGLRNQTQVIVLVDVHIL